MLHVTAMLRADPAIQAEGQKVNAKYFSAAELSSFGMDIHAGVGETSGMLAIRPDLVSPSYRKLPSRVGRSLEELRELATRRDGRGIFPIQRRRRWRTAGRSRIGGSTALRA